MDFYIFMVHVSYQHTFATSLLYIHVCCPQVNPSGALSSSDFACLLRGTEGRHRCRNVEKYNKM